MASKEFVEIDVKSVLNRVSGMPFRWSINPYRGCSHGCPFCMSGETPILMADGCGKRLDEIRVGDLIYGTIRKGFTRHYVHTYVLAHWATEKPAFRVTLEDGTHVVASADHRFLTDRGWKYVRRAGNGLMMRPFLRSNNRLMGTGAFAEPPVRGADYERGYLCGLIRGDGVLISRYEREGRAHGNHYRFRLAVTDGEALVRAQRYLLNHRVATPTCVAQPATVNRREMGGTGTSARTRVDEIERVVRWPLDPSLAWQKGFLAGIFDAEGSYSGGILRISNTNPMIINFTARSLERLGFSFIIESGPGGVRPIRVIRLLGGLREHLRFFHTVDPAIPRKRNIAGTALKPHGSLRVASVEPIGIKPLFDITTGTGDFIANGVVSHNCYARRTHWFIDEDGIDRWSSKIFVKVNAPAVLRGELGRPSWKREEVALGTATDPYQAIEGRYRITRAILEALRDFRTPVGIVTRCPLIVRDLDVLSEIAGRVGVTVCVSIATMDRARAREIEPTVAPPAQRLRAVRMLVERGIRTGVLLAPILPGLTDDPEHLAEVVQAAAEAGVSFVGHRVLYLGHVTKDAFNRFLARRHPELLPLYRRLYPGQYAPSTYTREIAEIVTREKARVGPLQSRYVRPPAEPEQVALF